MWRTIEKQAICSTWPWPNRKVRKTSTRYPSWAEEKETFHNERLQFYLSIIVPTWSFLCHCKTAQSYRRLHRCRPASPATNCLKHWNSNLWHIEASCKDSSASEYLSVYSIKYTRLRQQDQRQRSSIKLQNCIIWCQQSVHQCSFKVHYWPDPPKNL